MGWKFTKYSKAELIIYDEILLKKMCPIECDGKKMFGGLTDKKIAALAKEDFFKVSDLSVVLRIYDLLKDNSAMHASGYIDTDSMIVINAIEGVFSTKPLQVQNFVDWMREQFPECITEYTPTTIRWEIGVKK